MKRLRVHRERGEQQVVGLGHGSNSTVVAELPVFHPGIIAAPLSLLSRCLIRMPRASVSPLASRLISTSQARCRRLHLTKSHLADSRCTVGRHWGVGASRVETALSAQWYDRADVLYSIHAKTGLCVLSWRNGRDHAKGAARLR